MVWREGLDLLSRLGQLVRTIRDDFTIAFGRADQMCIGLCRTQQGFHKGLLLVASQDDDSRLLEFFPGRGFAHTYNKLGQRLIPDIGCPQEQSFLRVSQPDLEPAPFPSTMRRPPVVFRFRHPEPPLSLYGQLTYNSRSTLPFIAR